MESGSIVQADGNLAGEQTVEIEKFSVVDMSLSLVSR